MVYKNKKTHADKLPEALWAYRTTIRTSTLATVFSSLRVEEKLRGAVLPLEIHLPSLRVAVHEENCGRKNFHSLHEDELQTIVLFLAARV